MRINPTPQQLAAFLRVAETGSFSDAARSLAVSQPALSRTIRLLEDRIGSRLFDRDTRNVTLTAVGAELKPLAERLTADYEHAFGELAHFVAGRRGRITVAALPSLAAALLPPAIAALHTDHPDVAVVILDGLSGSVVDAVAEGRAEIGLTVQPAPTRALHYQPLIADELGLVCRADDPLAGHETLPWSVFRERRFIAMAPASSVRALTDAAFLQAGLAIPALYECAFLGTTGALVEAGLGITALPLLTLPLLATTALVWRPLTRPALRRAIGVVTPAGRSPAPATAAFLAVLARVAGTMSV
jgi:LysR family carnitine catabolism transcriptional activator